MVNHCSLTNCAVTELPLRRVSLRCLVSFNVIHQSNKGALKHIVVTVAANIITMHGLYFIHCTLGTRARKAYFSQNSSWTIADALL